MENKKILTKEELKIIALFRDNIFGRWTIRDIGKRICKKSYNWVFNAVEKLNELEILKIEKEGGSNICTLNLDNELTLMHLALFEQLKINEKLPLKNIRKLIYSIPVCFFTFVVTGSYAEGKHTSRSDLDVVVIVENKEDTKRIFAVLKNKGELMMPKAHVFVFSKEEFLKMLLEKEENYGKEIFRKKILFFGAENFYLILKEAIENGFKG